METEIDRPGVKDHVLHVLLVLLVLTVIWSLSACAPMQAGRYDADHGTPFAHAPSSPDPVSWTQYLVALGVAVASGGGVHYAHTRKKKA